MATKKVKKKKYAFPMDVVRLIRKVEKKILEEPKRFAMNIIAVKYSEDQVKNAHTLPPCGTVACIAGWIGLIEMKNQIKWKRADWDGEKREVRQNLWNFAKNRLHILETAPESQCDPATYKPLPNAKVTAQTLFLDDQWPDKFRDKFHNARSHKQKAEVAVARLEHMITTGQ